MIHNPFDQNAQITDNLTPMGNKLVNLDTSMIDNNQTIVRPNERVRFEAGALPGQKFGSQTGEAFKRYDVMLTIPAALSDTTPGGWGQGTLVKIPVDLSHNYVVMHGPVYASNVSPTNRGYVCLDLTPPSWIPGEAGNFGSYTTTIGMFYATFANSANSTTNRVEGFVPMMRHRTYYAWVASTGQGYTSTVSLLVSFTVMTVGKADLVG